MSGTSVRLNLLPMPSSKSEISLTINSDDYDWTLTIIIPANIKNSHWIFADSKHLENGDIDYAILVSLARHIINRLGFSVDVRGEEPDDVPDIPF